MGQEGLQAFFSWQPDLVVLDVMLPRTDGLKLLGRIREVELAAAAVTMLTVLGQEHQKVLGWRSGADDYMPKPSSLAEFLARVEALLRRVDLHPNTYLGVLLAAWECRARAACHRARQLYQASTSTWVTVPGTGVRLPIALTARATLLWKATPSASAIAF